MIERFERFSFLISEISRYWHKLAAQEMESHGLKGPHSVYLMALNKHPDGLTSAQLCEMCSRDKSDVSRMMAIMQQKGLVVKESNHQNLYRATFKLTSEGIDAVKKVSDRVELATSLVGEKLSQSEREILYSALESIKDNLKKFSEEGLPN